MVDKLVMDPDGTIRREPDLLVWARWYERDENRVVGNDTIGDVTISTVFLGLPYVGNAAPFYFETLIMGGPLDGERDHYATFAAARAGHVALVDKVRSALRAN